MNFLHTLKKGFFLPSLIGALLFLTFSAPNANASPDFDNDGKADFGVFRQSDRSWYSFSTELQTSSAVQWGLSTDALVPADYDGDGITDIAVWRPSNGVWYILQSRDKQLFAVQWGTVSTVPGGSSPDVPVPADYDGDGQTDIAVWRPSTGVWYVLQSSDGYNPQYAKVFQWGKLGDVPVTADYDGDRKNDYAVFRPSENRWYIFQSETNSQKIRNFGLGTEDLLVPADYTGDGKADIAVYRKGIWYIERSQDGQVDIFQFGLADDTPVPADYDGDGHADIAVFRRGIWYIIESSTIRQKTVAYGLADDIPINSAYIRRGIVPIP